jgi:hypothetical protein
MTLVSRISACALAALIAIPMMAQGPRRRAVSPNGNATVVLITAHDAAGVPAENGKLTIGDKTYQLNTFGQLQIALPVGSPTTFSITHPAFLPFTQTITAQPGGKFDLTLTTKPSVTIKTVNNETHVVDIGTAQFAYQITFGSSVASDKANFCLPDGSSLTPDKTELSRIVGPVTTVSSTACCPVGSGNVLAANIELKSGVKEQVYFKDSCGNEADFLGREKSTGRYYYVRINDIAEIDFP